MPLTLPANIILEKNKIATPSAFIILLEVTLPDSTKFYLTNNNEDVTYNTQLYTALPIEIDARKETVRGEIPSINLRLCNITRLLTPYIENTAGAIGSTIKLTVVNTELLGETYTELEMIFDVTGCTYDTYWVSLTIGPPNPLRKRFPLHRYLADRCMWVSRFKGAECKYNNNGGTTFTTCDGTLENCEERLNSENYGGFKGLSGGNLKIA